MIEKTDRPMSEYESALFTAVRVLGLAIVEKGGNCAAIQAGLEEMAELADESDRKNEAATLRLLLRGILEPGIAYIPGKPN